jgi:hypothetical protein
VAEGVRCGLARLAGGGIHLIDGTGHSVETARPGRPFKASHVKHSTHCTDVWQQTAKTTTARDKSESCLLRQLCLFSYVQCMPRRRATNSRVHLIMAIILRH